MGIRILLLFLAASFLAPAQTRTMSVEKLVIFLRSSIKLKMEDRTLAYYVKKIKLTDHLDDVTIENLQGEGLGPKTVQALKDLGTASASLPAPPPPAPPPPKPVFPPPSDEEQKRVLDSATEYS